MSTSTSFPIVCVSFQSLQLSMKYGSKQMFGSVTVQSTDVCTNEKFDPASAYLENLKKHFDFK